LDSRVLLELLPLGAVEDLKSGGFAKLLIAEKLFNKRNAVNTRGVCRLFDQSALKQTPKP
jgi:hypothetical protein